jgi:hypothetical protein
VSVLTMVRTKEHRVMVPLKVSEWVILLVGSMVSKTELDLEPVMTSESERARQMELLWASTKAHVTV